MAEAPNPLFFRLAQQAQAEKRVGCGDVGKFAGRQAFAAGLFEFLQLHLRARHAGQFPTAQEGGPLIDAPAPLVLIQHANSFLRKAFQG